MKHNYFLAISVAILVMLTAACGGQPTPTQAPVTQTPAGGPVEDSASLEAALRAEGATVAPGGEIEQPFFSVKVIPR